MIGAAHVWLLPGAGPGVGLGHLARCTALAEAFQGMGWRAAFLAPAAARAWLAHHGQRHLCLETGPGEHLTEARRRWLARLSHGRPRVLVVDLPDRPGAWRAQRRRWLEAARELVPVCVGILDLPQRRGPPCELAVNANSGAEAWEPPAGPGWLAGLGFQPVRRAVLSQRPRAAVAGQLRLLVCLGSRPEWLAALVGCLAERLGDGGRIGVVGLPGRAFVRAGCRVVPVRDPRALPGEAAQADLALVGGGQLRYEAAALGLPALAVPLAEDQRPSCRAWGRLGMPVSVARTGSILTALEPLLSDPARRRFIARRGRELVDGLGGRRLASQIVELWRARRGAQEAEECA
jgi:UDP-2,4-diacetamido-2,4,6-trideoxy-beta-L-altropyranose hydrolase